MEEKRDRKSPTIAVSCIPLVVSIPKAVNINTLQRLQFMSLLWHLIMAARQLAGRRPLYFTADVSILLLYFFFAG